MLRTTVYAVIADYYICNTASGTTEHNFSWAVNYPAAAWRSNYESSLSVGEKEIVSSSSKSQHKEAQKRAIPTEIRGEKYHPYCLIEKHSHRQALQQQHNDIQLIPQMSQNEINDEFVSYRFEESLLEKLFDRPTRR